MLSAESWKGRPGGGCREHDGQKGLCSQYGSVLQSGGSAMCQEGRAITLSAVGILAVCLAPSASATGLSRQEVMKRAIEVKPHPRQLAWQQLEFTCFLHFGMNTFTNREWGTGTEEPSRFNPTQLDTDQWCRNAKAAGMQLMLLVVKHHDGFCLWQTRYTDHSVASSPWRDGRGDVLRDLAESCRKHGMKVGVYLSPADLNQVKRADGLYGNRSPYSERIIPRPVSGRPFQDGRSFHHRVDDYNEYFMSQLFELLTEYGPIHEVWFDGAEPEGNVAQKYAYNQWYTLIRELAPQAVIAVKGPDVRWCGNEGGRTRDAEWSVVPIGSSPDTWHWPDLVQADVGSLARLTEALQNGGCLHWYPAETNVSIRRGWFWHENQPVMSAAQILDIWFRSVGGNSVFLLNVPPNRRGLFGPQDCQVLQETGRVLRQTFSMNLAAGAPAAASSSRQGGFAPANVLDDDSFTCWMPREEETRPWVSVVLPEEKMINCVVLQEQIRDYGQRVARFTVSVMRDGRWRRVADMPTIGYKRICRFPDVATDRVMVQLVEFRGSPAIGTLGLYRQHSQDKVADAAVDHVR